MNFRLINRLLNSISVGKKLARKGTLSRNAISKRYLHKGIGQPSFMTHPNLISKDEITPFINRKEYDLRRRLLISKIQIDDVIICFGSNLKFYSTNIFYPFEQNRNLFYLTGYDQPNSILVLKKSNDALAYKMTLFVSEKDHETELWEGPKCGIENAKTYFGSHEAYPLNMFAEYLEKQSFGKGKIYLEFPSSIESDSPEACFQSYIAKKNLNQNLIKLDNIVYPLRLIKSKAEIELLKRSSRIASNVFKKIMLYTYENHARGIKESDVAAEFEYLCRGLGAKGNAYVPVVASGENALSLHYTSNDMKINSTDMIMMDAGTNFYGYMSDITRTWPVSGVFTESQKELYRAVLCVHRKCVKMCTTKSNMSLNQILESSIDLMHEELKKLGFKCNRDTICNKLYPHHIGHYLGLEVHDTYAVSRNVKLMEGMVLTIEPGLYIPNDTCYPGKYRNIGIRIEDNILVTSLDDPIVLTQDAPREVFDVECTCQGEFV